MSQSTIAIDAAAGKTRRCRADLHAHEVAPIALALLGAGSHFCPTLINDVLQIPGAVRGRIALVDTDGDRLAAAQRAAERLIVRNGRENGWTVVADTDRRAVLAGTRYLINSIEVGGLDCLDLDHDIPARYGVTQCVGDTIGPGGIFRALRTVPVYLDILHDAEELCSDALVLNYTNPMSMLCLAAGRASVMRTVGLCHSVQHTVALLARRLGLAAEELDFSCAGINHLAWIVALRHNGRDVYPRLKAQARAELYGDPADSDNAKPDDAAWDRIRKDMMLHFGAYITESSGHLSEYVPYYRKRLDLMERYSGPTYDGVPRFYPDNWPQWRRERLEALDAAMAVDEPPAPRSVEYASRIIEAAASGRSFTFHGNVMNRMADGGLLVENLLPDGCVEVACVVDGDGVRPQRFGALPAQMAALCRADQAVFDLAVDACLERSKQKAIHALMLDPHTASVCCPAEIERMACELFEAESDYLSDYKQGGRWPQPKKTGRQ